MAHRVLGFEISVSARDDGTLEAAYIRFKNTKVYKTQELIEDTLVADYDRSGDLVGVEILAPVKIRDVTRQVEANERPALKRFVESAMPEELLAAS